MNRKRGFTIVELLIVIVIIGILATLIILAYNGIQQRARLAKRKADTSTMMKWLELYYTDNGMYPASDTGTDFVTSNTITNSTTKAQLKALLGTSDSIQDPSDSSSTPIITPGFGDSAGKYLYFGGFYYPGPSGSVSLYTGFGEKEDTIYCNASVLLNYIDRYAASVFSFYDESSDTFQIFTSANGIKPTGQEDPSKCIWH